MNDNRKTKKQLIEELEQLRERVSALEGRSGAQEPRAEEALRESEAKYRQLYDNAQIGLFRTNVEDGLFLDANCRMAEMFGYESPQELVKKVFAADLYADPDVRSRIVAELKQRGRIDAVETPFKRKDGSMWWARFSGQLYAEKGEFEGVAEDITEQKKAKEQLKSSKEFAENLLETAHALIVTLDVDAHIMVFNKFAEELTGYSKSEVLGKSWFDTFIPAADKDSIPRVFADALQRMPQVSHFENAILTKSGEERLIGWSNNVIYDNSGDINGVLSIGSDITEAKKAEEELRMSRERFKNLSGLSFEGIIFHERGIVIDVNESLTRILGYDREELIGENIVQLAVEPEYIDTVRENIARQYAKPYEVMARKKDGTVFPVEIEARNVEGEDFRVTAIRDITWRREAQAALRESEEKYRLLVENQTDLIAEIDLEGRFRFVSPSYCRLFGKTEGELLGKTFMPLVHEEDRQSTEEAMEGLYRPPHTAYIEQRAMTRDGWRWLAWQDTAILDESGNVKAIVGIGRDITERRQAEEALRSSEKKHRGFLDNLNAGVVAYAPDTSIMYCNQMALKFLGLSMDQMAGKTAVDLQWKFLNEDGTDMALEDSPINRALASPEKLKGYVVGLRRPDRKSVSWLACNSFRVLDEKGELETVLISFFDVSETKRLEALESRAERLETAGRIAGQVAHDFNNLLGPLTAYPDLIRDELPRNHNALSYLGSMEKAAQQIADINQQLLTLARRGHYNQVPLNLNEIVLQAVKELESQSETLVFDIKLAADIMNVMGGEAQIHRAISNLLNNARDAMGDIGTITVETANFYADNVSIQYGRIPKGEYVKATVADTGCGIPEEDILRIFDPFYTSKTSDKERGSGLGLSIVDAVVNDHNGYVDLRSKVGEGTSFYLYFPVTRAAISGAESALVVGGTNTVLVVDDDEIQRELSTTLLNKLGYKVSTADSGEKAIDFIREHPQDILLLDMVMPPGIDGAETYKRILEIVPNQKAIIVSGFSESDRVLEAQKSGAGAFIKKPFTLQTIAAAVRRELDA